MDNVSNWFLRRIVALVCATALQCANKGMVPPDPNRAVRDAKVMEEYLKD